MRSSPCQIPCSLDLFFSHERGRGCDARFDVLRLPDRTYFESDPPFEDKPRLQPGPQVVIALIVNSFPLVRGDAGQHLGPTGRLCGEDPIRSLRSGVVMDRGIPTDSHAGHDARSDAPVHSLVGTPKGRLTKLEKSFLGQPWQAVARASRQAPRRGRGAVYPRVAGPQRTQHAKTAAEETMAPTRAAINPIADQLLLKLARPKRKQAGLGTSTFGARDRQTGHLRPSSRPAAPSAPREGRYLLPPT